MVPKRLTTDYGTVIMHGALVVSFVVLAVTGLRIAADDPVAPWLQAFDPLLPSEHLWYRHLVAGAVMMAALSGYVVYVRGARLTARVQLDKTRLVAFLRPGRGRIAAVNVLVYWIMMAGLAVEVVTGVMLFLEAGRAVLSVHLYAAFVCLAAVALHIALHAAYGGVAQVLRIVRPGPLHATPNPPDFAELLAEHLAEAKAKTVSGEQPTLLPKDATPPPLPPTTLTLAPSMDVRPVIQKPLIQEAATSVDQQVRAVRLQANPFVTGIIAASVVGGVAVTSEQLTRPALHIAEIKRSDAPVLDGDLSDPVWTKAKVASVLTTQGGDFGGSGQSLVQIRAVHDGEFAYFAIVWEDPTRSLKQQPLVKRGGRWTVAASREDLLDETKYHDDKFAVLLTRPMMPLIGAAIHLARRPLASLPESSTGRGLHYTDGGIADLWFWRASHAGDVGYVANCHFGGPVSPQQRVDEPTAHYSGGFSLDPGQSVHQSNAMVTTSQSGSKSIVPRRLPRDSAAMMRLMGRITDSTSESESEASRWWMSHRESVPYTPQLDAAFQDGTVVPGILISDDVPDTRDAIRGAAHWAAGRWTLEVVRRLHTGSDFDVPLRSGSMLWVAAFDHAEMRHTRHLRPFRLELE